MIRLSRLLGLVLAAAFAIGSSNQNALGQGTTADLKYREELWALATPWPILAWVVRPVGDKAHALVIMNHGLSLDTKERTFFPPIEYRDAAFWFAERGYMVVSPIRYGGTGIDNADLGLFPLFAAGLGRCDNPDFKGPGFHIARLNQWVIDYLASENIIEPKNIIVVGQSGGGWGSIALSSLNPSSVRAIITFAAGRGGRVDGKPNNNCAPDKLVETAGYFGRTSRIPMLWIYAQNDTYFGPELAQRMHSAFTTAGGKAEIHVLSAFGADGHFLIDSPGSIPMWGPLVSRFLKEIP